MHNKRDMAVRICAQFWSIQHNREVDYLKANIQEKEGKSSAHTQTHTHTQGEIKIPLPRMNGDDTRSKIIARYYKA